MTGLTSHWYLILIVLIIVLIIWGPGKLPDVGAGMGRAIREFRKASSETRDSFMSAATTEPTPAAAPPQPPVAPVAPAAPPPPPADPYHSPAPPHSPVSG